MPYDLQTPADLLALFQVFLAAHPHHRAATEAMREVAQMPGDYFASLPLVQELAAWARQRHLMTRRSAQELVARAQLAFTTDPGTVVQVTRYTGTGAPPPTVEWSDCWQWITLQPAVPEERGRLLLPHASELAEAIARDATEMQWMRWRAGMLSQWLHAQQEA